MRSDRSEEIKAPPSAGRRPYLAAVIILAAGSFCFNLSTIRTGLPDSARLQLLFNSSDEHLKSVPLLARLRDKIYDQIGSAGYYAHAGQFTMSPDEQGPHFSRSFLLQTIWPDEPPVARALQSIKPKELRFNPHFHLYGAPAIYIVGAAIKLGQFIGLYPNPRDIIPFLQNPDYSGRLWAAPRFFSALILALAVVALYLTAGALFGASWGVLAAFLLAASPVAAMETHFLKPYLISLLCTTAIFYFLIKREHRWAAGLAGLSAAFLTTNAVFSAVVCAAALRDGGKQAWKNALLCAGISSLVFFAADPWWLLSAREVISDLIVSAPPSGGITLKVASPLEWVKVWISVLPVQMGLYLAIPAAAGAVSYVFKKEYVAGYCLLTLLLISPFLVALRQAHYMVPALPAVIILAVYGWREAWRFSPVISAAAMGLAAAFMFLHLAFYQSLLLNLDSVQRRAGAWLNSNLPAKTYIAVDNIINPVSMYPPFHMIGHQFLVQNESVQNRIGNLKKEKPRYYLAVCGEPITREPGFLKLYKEEISFESRIRLDNLFANHLWPKLTCPVSVYKFKDR